MVNGVMILFFVWEKRSLGRLFLLILALCALLLCGMFRKTEEDRAAFSVPAANKIVVLDAGHGGFDGGATANGVTEKDVNLDIALRVREYLEQAGGIVLLTRSEDVSTAQGNQEGVSAKKSDLSERKKLADSSDADIFVSIHMNKFPQEQYRGAQVFYSSAPEESKRLGEEIQQSLKDILQDGNDRIAKKIDGGVFILKNTTIPSVIVECGFLSNPQEAQLLQQEDYRQKLAWGIYIGITRYFNQ